MSSGTTKPAPPAETMMAQRKGRAETDKLPVVRFIALVHVTNVMVNRFPYFHGMKQGKYLITYFMDVLTDF